MLIVDGTLVPTRDHQVAEQSKNSAHPRLRGEDLGAPLAVKRTADSPPRRRG
ncbi:hypothetical protein GCM10010317_100100 [Streptomyces mirabilis]|nr:hypothetical protein GCM10010317_100100 [Streptomyces mirabilis]